MRLMAIAIGIVADYYDYHRISNMGYCYNSCCACIINRNNMVYDIILLILSAAYL